MKASLQPKPMYCSRDYYYSSRFNQQYEKPTPVNFYSNHSTIIANLKTTSNKAAIIVPYKVDVVSDGIIMSFNIFPNFYPSLTMEQLVATKDVTKLRTYNHTITQLDRCKVELKIMTNVKNAFSLSFQEMKKCH